MGSDMKKIFLMILAAIMLVSCGTAKQAGSGRKPGKTYAQPGTELLDAPDVLRAWAMGTSNSKTTARKKAVTSASAELSRMLNSVVAVTIDDYCVTLADGVKATASKEYLSQKINVVSEQMLLGIRPIFDRCEGPDAEGMYHNYVVLELSAEEFIKRVIESLDGSQGAKKVDVDEKLLNDLFVKTVNAGK